MPPKATADRPPGTTRITATAGHADVVLFALLAGTIATFAHGYYYGLVNHIEQLPQIMRLLDPAFLRVDFAVNATAGYGPRFFYSWLVALLGRCAPLPTAFLALTVAQNSLVALVTFLAARRLAAGSVTAGAAATALVLSVESMHLGEAGFLRLPALIPASLVTGVALLSLWEAARGRPFLAAVLAALAALIHPLLGLLCGMVGLCGAALAVLFLQVGRSRSTTGSSILRSLVPIVVALAALGIFGVLVWLLPQQPRLLDSRQMIDIYGYFRNPHHIIPSRFPVRDWLAAGAFFLASGVSVSWWWRRPDADRVTGLRLVLMVFVVLLLWLAGWFFVEVVPSRLVATLQTFRLSLIPKWLGLMFFGITIARSLSGSSRNGSPLAGSALYVLSGPAQPWFALVWHVVELVRRRLSRGPAVGIAILVLAVTIPLLFVFRSADSFKETFALVAIALMSWGLLALRHPWRYPAALALTALAVALPVSGAARRLPLVGHQFAAMQPVFTLADAREPGDAVAAYCRASTPEDAIFVVPPLEGRFRIVARRAIVVDFKYAMVHDWAILEWRQRLADCYGAVTQSGFAAAGEMDWHYRSIPDEQLRYLRYRYGATFAVLYRGTPSSLPELYEDETYKLVEIPEN